MNSSLSRERTIETENNFEYSRPHGYCSDRWWNRVLVLQQRARTVQLEGRRDAWGTETLTKVCGEFASHRDGVQSRCNKLLLYAYIETLFPYAIPVTEQ